MAGLFFTLSISIIYCTFFLVITGNPSFAITNNTSNNTFYLGTHENVTWYTKDAEIMDGWKMTVILSVKNQSLGFYFGLYYSQRIHGYLLAVVVVGGSEASHTVVWSSDRYYPVRENSYTLFSRFGGFVLVDQNVSNYAALHPENEYIMSPMAGIKLTEEGNLILLGSEINILWQSFHNPVDTLLVGQRLYNNRKLKNDVGSFAGLTEVANFSVFINNVDNSSLIYYQTPLDLSSRRLAGLQYGEDTKGGYIVNLGDSEKSYPLEFTDFLKLDSDGRLRNYRYGYSNQEIVTTVALDMIISQCPRNSQDRHHLREVRNRMYFDFNSTNAAVNSVTTLSECQRVCTLSCSCTTALFSYENNVSSGYCYISSDIFSPGGGQINYDKSLTFIKVLDVIGELSPDVHPTTPSPSPSPTTGENTPKAIPPTLPSRHPKNKLSAILVSASTAGGLIMILLIILISLVMLRRNQLESDGEGDHITPVPGMPLRLSFEELEIATQSFSETLGCGGFGSVFKGMLADGTVVAVKRLDKMSQDMREFLAEVETIGSIHHFNLVRLVGFCAEKSCRLLVYEYMSNGSLDKWIFNRDQAHFLDWQTRKKIILDIAKGLAYLHEDCRQKIIHLDIKPHNILLDESFNAKVSDFGLSKLIERDESQVVIPMRGTPGYLAPELGRSRVTVKADVYSYGIVILEIVSKRRNVDSSRSESSFHLLKMLQRKAEEDQLINIVEDLDEEMQNNREEVARMIRIGAWCLQEDHTKRPTMSTVVKVLEGVMEVEPNISYKFSHAMASASVANDHNTVAPQASVLSAPR